MFLWEYSDEGIADQYPQVEKQSSLQSASLVESLIEKSDSEAIKNIKQKGKLTVKVGLRNVHTEKRQYVFRNVSPTTPLRDAIQAYLDGATSEESKQGYLIDTLGINIVKTELYQATFNTIFKRIKLA